MSTIKTRCHQCGAELIRKSAPSVKSKVHFCNSKCKGEYQRTFKPVSKEWLYEQYITKGLNATEIAHIVNRDPKSVWNWLKDFEIPTRPRGHGDTTNQFKAGEPSKFTGHRHTSEFRKAMSDHAKAIGRVPYDPAVGSYMKGRKGDQVHNWKGGISPERAKFYSSLEWKAAIKEVWKRDNATCQRCGKRNSSKERFSFDIHHIVSFKCVELRTNIDNLVLLCEICHYWVHGSENVLRIFLKDDPDE